MLNLIKQTTMDEKNKQLFLGLYQMVLSDAEVHPKELELLYQIGKEKGISEEDVQKALFSPNSLVSSTDLNDDEKIEYLYNLAQIAWADGHIDDKEKETLQNTTKRLGFAEEYVTEITDFLLSQAHERKSVKEVLETIKNL
jgi:DnaJ-domain-containing protein 1